MKPALPGIVLMLAAAAALLGANSPRAAGYAALWTTRLGPLTLHHWIDDALMAVFFFQIGLEVKRALVEGDLATPAARRLPVVAAAAGMVVPAIVYLGIAGGDPALARGWAIASATDIAFALGVLLLLGNRVPASLRLFLTTVAIADDIGAVAIIALAYTASLDGVALAAAAAIVAALWALNRRGVRAIPLYLLLALLLWIAVYRSGIHPTIAGVVAALFVPIAPLRRLEHGLAPWVSYLVLPVFGFANAGVALGDAPLLAPLPLAVMLGLFLGKQAGVFGAVRALSALGIARPAGASWRQLYGVALLAGIGFTMSLFIGGLAFADPALAGQAKIGVLAGSLLSGMAGYLVLRLAPPSRTAPG